MKYTYNFIEFLDSQDIAEFNIATEFTPAEQAVLICMSEKRTIQEKMDALRYLIDSYSEEEFKVDSITTIWEYACNEFCFRDTVSATIKLWESVLNNRYDNNCVVFAACLYEKGYENSELREFQFFSNYENAYTHLKNEKQRYTKDDDLKDIETHGEILRLKLDSLDKDFTDYDGYYYNNDLDLVNLVPNKESDITNINSFFRNLETDCYVHVPLPFKKGDIVKVESPFYKTYYGVIADDLPNREHDPNLQRESADLSDMVVTLAVYNSKTGKWAYTDDTWCLHLAYCKDEELPEKEKVLKTFK